MPNLEYVGTPLGFQATVVMCLTLTSVFLLCLCSRVVWQKQMRKSPSSVEVQAIYYIMEGNIYQAPTVQKLIKSRLDKFTHHLNNAFGEI